MKILHKDHGITEAIWKHIFRYLVAFTDPGFFIKEILLPPSLGEVPCAIYGPSMGDEPIQDNQIIMLQRTPDRPVDRMINMPMRSSNKVQVIGVWDFDLDKVVIYTCYGGPLAPQNPLEAGLSEEKKKISKRFWSQHALSTGMIEPELLSQLLLAQQRTQSQL